MAVWFGVFVVERLLAQHEDAKRAPARRAGWRELLNIHFHLVRFINEVAYEVRFDARDAIRLAWERQDSRYLCEAFAQLEVDPRKLRQTDLPSQGVVRFYADFHFSRARAAAERFMTRYLTFMPPAVISLVESLETHQIVTVTKLMPNNVGRFDGALWASLFENEAGIRKILGSTRELGEVEYGDDTWLLLPHALEWLEAGTKPSSKE